MKGINLRSLKRDLVLIDDATSNKPVTTIEDIPGKLAFCQRYIDVYFSKFDFLKDYPELPLGAFRHFSFDELCKLKYSKDMMDDSARKLFNTNPEYRVVEKIRNSMWTLSFSTGTWNEVVEFHQHLKSVDLGLEGFSIRLDYTTGHNEKGYSQYARVWLDGVFGFLVYYQNKHVMTVSFSVMAGRQILLHQVQLTSSRRNRWLYQFPENRLEFFLALFRKCFPNFTLHVVDGKSLANQVLKGYQELLDRALRYADAEAIARYEEKIMHLKSDRKRIARFYQNIGSFERGSLKEVRSVRFHRVL